MVERENVLLWDRKWEFTKDRIYKRKDILVIVTRRPYEYSYFKTGDVGSWGSFSFLDISFASLRD